jgi:hypothetical protein
MRFHSVILSEAKDLTIVRKRLQLMCDVDWDARFLASLGMTKIARGLRTQFLI